MGNCFSRRSESHYGRVSRRDQLQPDNETSEADFKICLIAKKARVTEDGTIIVHQYTVS